MFYDTANEAPVDFDITKDGKNSWMHVISNVVKAIGGLHPALRGKKAVPPRT